jgi:hypothetical protein
LPPMPWRNSTSEPSPATETASFGAGPTKTVSSYSAFAPEIFTARARLWLSVRM